MTTPKSPELLLPKNTRDIQDMLEEKKKRIEECRREHPHWQPQSIEKAMALKICQVAILEELLSSGKAVSWDLYNKMIKERQGNREIKDLVKTFSHTWGWAWYFINIAVTAIRMRPDRNT
ncbi:MAG: hypothetical protein Q8P63_01285 [Candidatus Nealsonbacteria bacterium]|nr:hypothetical protein [Candidatus Nealsonbacteria bacterium]